MIGQCPRGYICINNFNLIGILVIIIIVLFFIGREYSTNLTNKIDRIQHHQKEIRNEINKPVSETPHVHQPTVVVNKDIELIRNPLLPPVRRNYHIDRDPYYTTTPGVPINVPTRGYVGDYQQIGMLYKEAVDDESVKPGNNTDSNILPLYGKPLYSNSSKWLYYTGSDKFNNIKIPITVNNRDCTDDHGCDELYNDDTVNIPSYNGNFKVKIYKFDKPRYLPFIY